MSVSTILASTSLLTLTVEKDLRTRLHTCGKCWPGPRHGFDSGSDSYLWLSVFCLLASCSSNKAIRLLMS